MRVQCLWRRRKGRLDHWKTRCGGWSRRSREAARLPLSSSTRPASRRSLAASDERAWFARNHAWLSIRRRSEARYCAWRAAAGAEVEKVTARMRHLDKFGPSER